MKCLTCGKRIDNPIEQFGDWKHPLCSSCYLAGLSWVYEDKKIVDELLQGSSINDALRNATQDGITELDKFAREFWNVTHNTDGTMLEQIIAEELTEATE